jgi:hypothetical protein
MRSFLGFGQSQYIGTPQAAGVKLGGIASVIVPLLLQWISYGASTTNTNVNVLVDLGSKPCDKLDQIRSLYIDNLGSNNPVYVYFPDSGYTVVAKPNSEGWYPVFTNQKTLWVIGEGFLSGDIPQTSIIVCNLFIPPQVNVEIDNAVALWKASPQITRGTTIYNSSLGIPALGDQFFASGQLNLNAGGSVGLWNTPYADGFLYVTGLNLNSFGTTGGSVQVSIESTGVAGVLLAPTWYGGAPTAGVSQIVNLSGMQIKLDATQTWRMRLITNIAGGFAQLLSSFTKNPN